ncbi:MAG: restriction endonuclease [Leptospirales bacterium]|nr:restriction endonuclease [Leptospirales bacterium]
MLILVSIIGLVAVAAGVYFTFMSERRDVYQRALNLAAQGHFVDARGLIRAKIEADTDNAVGHYTMARVYALEGKTEEEKAHLIEVRRINQYTAEVQPAQVLNRIGDIEYENGDYRASMDAYLASLQFSPQNEEALARIAFLCAGRGRYEIADKYFRTLVRVAPNTVDYRIGRGVILSALKNKEALREFETAAALAPNEPTAVLFLAFQAYKQREYERAGEALSRLTGMIQDPLIEHVTNRLAVVVHYLLKEYSQAIAFAQKCLATAVELQLKKEEQDARMTLALMGIVSGNLESANDHLLELEMMNPADTTVQRLSDFRMDVEEGAATLDRVSPRGFDFNAQLQDWLRNRFPEDMLFKLSGLAMDEEDFSIDDFFTSEGEVQKRKSETAIDPALMIERFNTLTESPFQQACARIIGLQGFQVEKTLPYRDRDGGDFIATSKADKKVKALFRIRKWKNQPISDIFLRDMQNNMNELKVNQGFVVAGTKLTPGAESALQNLKKITVIHELDLAELLFKVLGQ